jgi:hypothetical protein
MTFFIAIAVKTSNLACIYHSLYTLLLICKVVITPDASLSALHKTSNKNRQSEINTDWLQTVAEVPRTTYHEGMGMSKRLIDEYDRVDELMCAARHS